MSNANICGRFCCSEKVEKRWFTAYRGSAKHEVGFREGSSFFRGNDFLVQYVD